MALRLLLLLRLTARRLRLLLLLTPRLLPPRQSSKSVLMG
jgi:hypothetical protein